VAGALIAGVALAVPWARRLHGDAPHTLAVTGTIEAMQVDVSSKLSGRIVTLAAREGQRVKAGQQLVRLDAEKLGAETQRAEAALRNATATREWTERDFRRARELFAASSCRPPRARCRRRCSSPF
jgi:multidrug efflux pump subunit AcrA (membrane-fusion protein)